MKVGTKVCIDNFFKMGYIYSYNNTNKYRVVVISNAKKCKHYAEIRYSV